MYAGRAAQIMDLDHVCLFTGLDLGTLFETRLTVAGLLGSRFCLDKPLNDSNDFQSSYQGHTIHKCCTRVLLTNSSCWQWGGGPLSPGQHCTNRRATGPQHSLSDCIPANRTSPS